MKDIFCGAKNMKGKQLYFFESDEEKNMQKRNIVNLPLDTLIMFSIVIALLFALMFSLGVEKGRKIAYALTEKNEIKHEAAVLDTPAPVGASAPKKIISSPGEIYQNLKTQIPNAPRLQTANLAPAPVEAIAYDTNEQTAEENTTNKYLIQVATFMKENVANKEAKSLEKNGYPVLVAKKGKFIVVFVGNFKGTQEAQKNMKELKKKYKDCFLRRL